MPPTTAPTRTRGARRRWTVVLVVQLAAALLATGAATGSAADAGELVWLGEAGGQTEGRWTTDPSVRPWRDADGNCAAYQDGQPVVLDERAVNRSVVVADRDGVAPGSVRFSHRTGRYTLDAPCWSAAAPSAPSATVGSPTRSASGTRTSRDR